MLSQHVFDRIAQNLADIGAISFDDYLNGDIPAPPHPQPAPSPACAPHNEPADANAVTRLHQACQRALRSTDALNFEFIEHADSKKKQCILTITKPDSVQRSYATPPVFAKKSEAKLEAANIAIDMGALDFLAGGDASTKPVASVATSGTDMAAVPDTVSVHSVDAPETAIDTIEQCCLEWRAGHVVPSWVPFFDARSARKQGCALRIQLSLHVARVYLSDPTFDNYLDAKEACAKAAICEGVLGYIKHGNGQTRPPSPSLSSSSSISQPPPVTVTTPWTLQGFYDSLPRPFPESLDTTDAFEINASGWLNTMLQNARGGKFILSFFFPSDGPPGLHGCLLKLDRPGEYKAFLVDARFPKRSDAKAAVCLQAMSEGIGDYIRSITSAVDGKITSAMRSFSSSMAHPALASELSKIDTDLHPHFEYNKERDAFGATLVVRLSASATSEKVRRYTVSNNYRNKADAKVAVICHAAEQGVVEFVRFRGETPPISYTSPYNLDAYDPESSRKRKQPMSAGDAEQGRAAKKKKKRGKQRLEIPSSGDMDLSQIIPADCPYDPPQPGGGSAGGSGAARGMVYGRGTLYGPRMYASYSAVLDPRFAGSTIPGDRAYGGYPLPGAYGGGSYPSRAVDDVPPAESGLSRAWPGASSRALRRPAEHAELEPGEVMSLAESDFSESSSRAADEDDGDEVTTKKRDADVNGSAGAEGAVRGSKDKGKSKEMSPADMSSTASTSSHVKKLTEYCAMHRCGAPSFHETECGGRFQVWIVIGKERFDLPATYGSAEEGRQRVAKQVLARLSKSSR